jgi:putative membrane protein
VGFATTPPPRRARVKTPLSYHFLAAGHDDTIAVAVTGRLRRVSCWVPLEKLQSVRRVQGPVQRKLGLATVHVDVAGRRVEAAFRDRDAADSARLVDELAALSRVARSRALPDPQPRPTSGGDALQPLPAQPAPVPEGTTAPAPPPGWSPPGWRADPNGRHRHRYWDGVSWTAYVHDEGDTTSIDPI